MSELVDLAIQSDERGKAIDRCIVTLNHYGHEVTDDVSETIDHVCTALAAAVAERDRLRDALRDALVLLENGDFANGVTHFGLDEGAMAAGHMIERLRQALWEGEP